MSVHFTFGRSMFDTFFAGGLQEGSARERRLPAEGECQQQYWRVQTSTGRRDWLRGRRRRGAACPGAGEPLRRSLDAGSSEQSCGLCKPPGPGGSQGGPEVFSQGHSSASAAPWSSVTSLVFTELPHSRMFFSLRILHFGLFLDNFIVIYEPLPLLFNFLHSPK